MDYLFTHHSFIIHVILISVWPQSAKGNILLKLSPNLSEKQSLGCYAAAVAIL